MEVSIGSFNNFNPIQVPHDSFTGQYDPSSWKSDLFYWSDLADIRGRRELWWHGVIFKVPPFIVDGDGGWWVTCDNVAGEGSDVAVERGTVGVWERSFLKAPEDSDVARWLFRDNKVGQPLLKR